MNKRLVLFKETTQGQVLIHKEEDDPMSRILIIDDDTQIRTMLRLMLEHEGYEIDDAPNGKAGIDRHRETPADLIITDLIMPEKEGMQTIRELKQEFPEVKIIAMSGGCRLGPHEYLPLAAKLGALRVFRKPFGRTDLLQAIRELIA